MEKIKNNFDKKHFEAFKNTCSPTDLRTKNKNLKMKITQKDLDDALEGAFYRP